MKKVNRILSVALCLVMCLSLFGVAAFAEENVTTPEQGACDHAFNINVVAPTCADRGYTLYVCSKCGYYYSDNYTSAMGHNYGDWREVRAATCTEEGQMERECSRCHGLDTKTLPILPHVDEDGDGKCDACGAKVEVKKIFSPFEWLKSFIQFIRDLINGIFA